MSSGSGKPVFQVYTTIVKSKKKKDAAVGSDKEMMEADEQEYQRFTMQKKKEED